MLFAVTYDLGQSDQRAAFERVRTDSDARAAVGDRFVERLTPVVDRTARETGRSMTLSVPTVETSIEGETGVVTVGVRWENLAEHEGETVVLTTPFDDGFTPDRRFSVRAPDGYELTTSGPTPDRATGESVTWNAGRSLDDVEIRVEPVTGDVVATSETPADTGGAETTSESTAGTTTSGTGTTDATAVSPEDVTGATGPGPGVVGALLAVGAVAGLLMRNGS